jgi:hypothetical protein
MWGAALFFAVVVMAFLAAWFLPQSIMLAVLAIVWAWLALSQPFASRR